MMPSIVPKPTRTMTREEFDAWREKYMTTPTTSVMQDAPKPQNVFEVIDNKKIRGVIYYDQEHPNRSVRMTMAVEKGINNTVVVQHLALEIYKQQVIRMESLDLGALGALLKLLAGAWQEAAKVGKGVEGSG